MGTSIYHPPTPTYGFSSRSCPQERLHHPPRHPQGPGCLLSSPSNSAIPLGPTSYSPAEPGLSPWPLVKVSNLPCGSNLPAGLSPSRPAQPGPSSPIHGPPPLPETQTRSQLVKSFSGSGRWDLSPVLLPDPQALPSHLSGTGHKPQSLIPL